jgi:two-component system phosphate regulon sensor histidine kinase PhoR
MGTLTGRVFRSIFFTSVAAVLLVAVLFAGLAYAILDGQLRRELSNTAGIIESALPVQGVDANGVDANGVDANNAERAYLEGLTLRDIRMTWIAADGSVLYDNIAASTPVIENHLDRPEVQEALKSGTGIAARHSQTLDEETVYLARLLPDGTVLRVAGTQKNILGHIGVVLLPGILILLAVAAMAAVVARLTARRMLRPLSTIDFEQPLENDTYPELSPFLTRLDASHREIAAHNLQLKARRSEFDVVTASMREGLVLADAQGRVLFINAAAAALFDVSSDDVVGRHLLTLNRNDRIPRVVDSALSGERAEEHFEQDGQIYRLLASPVFAGTKTSGVALLVLNITEWYHADTQRREFTANVSHELKTPLTVINGYAELMERGMVEPKDRARFIRLIHDEATRLIALVDDIITLSQLDEGEGSASWSTAFEPVDLVALAREVAGRLASFAQEREVRLVLSPTESDAVVFGVPTLLSRMLYNLIENGIRYTNPSGVVTVSVTRCDETIVVRVQDTGIGIPAEFHDKVFERFFCIDRSRSRETGGTGLGLAIVKHGAFVHNADIKFQSVPGEGTTMELSFNRT